MNVAAVGDDGGISLVLGLDVAAFVACVLIFLLIRYCCRSYSQMGFASRKQWAIEFHKHQNTPLLDKRHSQPPEEHDLHWYSWILKVFYKLQDTEIFSRCGPDAVLYLTLERYLIALLVIFSFLSVAVILPINYLQGDQLMAGFDRTTIANVDSKSNALWVHTLFSLVYMFIVILFMIHYTLRLGRLKELYVDVVAPTSAQATTSDDGAANRKRKGAGGWQKGEGKDHKSNAIVLKHTIKSESRNSVHDWSSDTSIGLDPLILFTKVQDLTIRLTGVSGEDFDINARHSADATRADRQDVLTKTATESSYQRDQSSLPSSVAASFEATEPPAGDGMTSPLPVATDKSTRKSLSSSAITRDKLQSVAAVLEQHHRLKGEKNAGSLAIKLAKDALFGDEVLKLCTPMGNRSLPALSTKELQQLKAIIYQQFPLYANSPRLQSGDSGHQFMLLSSMKEFAILDLTASMAVTQPYQHNRSEVSSWLDRNQTAEKGEFEDKQKELEKVCVPIMTKLYQAGGVPNGAGGMSGGPSGSAGSGGKKSQDPTIEEVD
eukprot:Em0014g1005a